MLLLLLLLLQCPDELRLGCGLDYLSTAQAYLWAGLTKHCTSIPVGWTT
jgi:hypothetical protein